ncbi:MAG: membrane dipeptidase [Aeoliella sp.]
MIPLIDGHLDLAWNAVEFERDLTQTVAAINADEQGWDDSPARQGAVVSLPELQRGSVWLAFATLLARSRPQTAVDKEGRRRIHLDHRTTWGAYCAAHGQLAWYRKQAASGQLQFVSTRADLDALWQAKQAGRTTAVGIVLVMEGADPVAEIDDLDEWYDTGLRQINLVHYGQNQYAAGTGATGGLTELGRKLLARCERLGIALDVTHLADQAFFEALDLFGGPVLASHQNCRLLVDGGRQFTDEQIRLVIERGGVIGAAFDNWMLVEGWITGVTPRSTVTLDSVIDHIDHVCQIAGHHRAAAIGSDLDGGFGSSQAPSGIERSGNLQQLAERLALRGYDDNAILAIFHGNWLRWLREVLPEGNQPSAPAAQPMPITRSESGVHLIAPRERPVLVVGAGSIGERHARCFTNTGRAEVCICDVNAAQLTAVSERVDVVHCFANFEEAIATPLTAAVVATPAPHHLPQARQLIERGVPVLIEKPLSTSLDHVGGFLQLVDSQKVPVAVAYVQRFHPALAATRDAVIAGRIGQPLELVLQSGQDFPFYRPAFRETYYARRVTGGGAVQDALTHFLNTAEWIVGPVTAVLADVGRLALEGVEVEDTVHVIARHREVLASYCLNQHQPANESNLTVIGTTGMVRVELHANRWRIQHEPTETWTVHDLGTLERDDLFLAQANAFLDCIDRDAAPRCTVAEAAATLATQIAILGASEDPSWTSVPSIVAPETTLL